MSDLNFHHPFKPYSIQLELMTQIYALLESNKKVGIFESPTGTGKTLSLICSIVTWLRKHKQDYLSNHGRDSDSEDEPDWVDKAYESSVLKEQSRLLAEYELYLDDFLKNSLLKIDSSVVKKRKLNLHTSNSSNEPCLGLDNVSEDSHFLPNVCDSDSSVNIGNTGDQSYEEVKRLLRQFDTYNNDDLNESSKLNNPLKIYFASRTHSQLTQFTSQLRLPLFPPSFSNMSKERIKYLPLGSRKQLCIHPKVSKVKFDSINEICLDAIKEKKCVFYSNSRDPILSKNFTDTLFTSIHDIEDLSNIGEKLCICPYYSSRGSLAGAEIITLPYQHLLLEEARQSLNINLKNSIVVIDEAHNIIDTINTIHSASLSLSDLQKSKLALDIYFNKFKSRLSGYNRVNLLKLTKLIDILITFIKKNFKNGQEVNLMDLFLNSNADTLNIHELETYLKKSKVAYKIDDYIRLENTERPSEQPLLFKVASFLKTLENPSKEGKFFFEKGHIIKYMLLEPGESFRKIFEDTKCVILAGGTMEPISDFHDNLFPYIKEDEIIKFSCNHVIPDKNLNTFIIGDNFEFTFNKRSDESLVIDLFHFFYKLSEKVPFGIVGFFSSYSYLEFVLDVWKNKGLYDKINARKEVLTELNTNDNDILSKFSKIIEVEKKGAILLAVVGGKLSEGINFQDNLARAIVMVGLPFPNIFSGELIVKRKHLENKVFQNGGSKSDAIKASKEFYNNMCLKAVNQSIGRAIRHIDDYANIYLVDKRYNTLEIQSKLSTWVRKRIQITDSIQDVFQKTESFFKEKLLK